MEYKIPFINACIKAFGDRFILSRDKAYDYLQSHGGMAFLIEFYDVEHLQSIDDRVGSCIDMQEKWRTVRMKLYHGTNQDFDTINLSKVLKNNHKTCHLI